MSSELIPDLKNCEFKGTPFKNLMQKRIRKVLIVSSEYDAFVLEEDGRIEEQIFKEYVSLNLRYPPQILHANTAEEALKLITNTYIDLIITMLNVGQKFDVFDFAKEIKKTYSKKPVVLLTPFSRETSVMLAKKDSSAIDYVFSWLGSADILLAIIKLIEDDMNIKNDCQYGVQCILLVEDSVRYYSAYLTDMYKTLLVQSKKFMKEGLNEYQQMNRMRGRAKVCLAKNFEEATAIYETYKDNILGIISDTKYPREGKIDPHAGIRFVKRIKEKNPSLPVLLQSSNLKNRQYAKELEIGFLHKYSPDANRELTHFMEKYFAFGAFEFVNPETKEVLLRTANLKELQYKLSQVPDDSFRYHVERNHISKWLYARSLFSLACFFKKITLQDFDDDLEKTREFIYAHIDQYRKVSSRGIIAEFDRYYYDESFMFCRIGKGYMGGKARGLAFLDTLIKKNIEADKYPGVHIKIPRTVVLTTEVFDAFMENNDLYSFVLDDSKSNEEILQKFITCKLPEEVKDDLRAFLSKTHEPIAIRSSSLLEDSHYQPFAGVYSTYMLSNTGDFETNFLQLLSAIKSVYSSVYYKETKAYMQATKNVIDQEKMGIVLQKVSGNQYEDRFYPTFSGVARSINFYPLEDETAEEGVVNVALGLGKHIVEGKRSLQFSPLHPRKILQLSSPGMALSDTQKTFYALNLSAESFYPSTDEAVNYEKFDIKQAEEDESIYEISSVFDFQDNVLREGRMYQGKRLITFANVLKYNSFPLAEIVQEVLQMSQKSMNNPVEIEFAVNFPPENSGRKKEFVLLQIRPIVEENLDIKIDLKTIDKDDIFVHSKMSLGHGVIKDVYDFVYVKTEHFDSANNSLMVPIIEKINRQFVEENKNYILCGPGRWGSSDPWLGIPVKWSQISAARLIIESGLPDYRVEPSQGTHFFQNLTSFKVGYFNINPFSGDGIWDEQYLSQFDAVYEDQYIRHVRFDAPAIIKINGKQSEGAVFKPRK